MYTWTDRKFSNRKFRRKNEKSPRRGGGGGGGGGGWGAADYIDAVVLCDKGEYSVDKCFFPSKSKARAKSF